MKNRFLGFFLGDDGVFFPAQKYLSLVSRFSLNPRIQSVIKAEREKSISQSSPASWEKHIREIYCRYTAKRKSEFFLLFTE